MHTKKISKLIATALIVFSFSSYIDSVVASDPEVALPIVHNVNQQRAEVVVAAKNYEDLRSAIQSTKVFDRIVLEGDITIPAMWFPSSSGITIPKERTSFVIDGNGYQIIDSKDNGASSQYRSIRMSKNNNPDFTLEIRNTTIVGNGNYGIVNMSDSVIGATVKFTNVRYTGPQMVTNRNGSVVFENVNIHSEQSGYREQSQEIGELTSVIFRGDNTITFNRNAPFGIFQFNGSNPRTLLDDDASLVISTNRYYFSYGSGWQSSIQNYTGNPGSRFELHAWGVTGYELFEANNFNLNNSVFKVSIAGEQKHHIMTINDDISIYNQSQMEITNNGQKSSAVTQYPYVDQKKNNGQKVNIKNSTLRYVSTTEVPSVLFNLGDTSLENVFVDFQINNTYLIPDGGALINVKTLKMSNSTLSVKENYAASSIIVTEPLGFRFEANNNIDVHAATSMSNYMLDTKSPIIVGQGSRININIATINNSDFSYITTPKLQVTGGELRLISDAGEIDSFISNGTQDTSLEVDTEALALFFSRGGYRAFASHQSPRFDYSFTGQQINQWKTSELTYSDFKLSETLYRSFHQDKYENTLNIFGSRKYGSYTTATNHDANTDSTNPQLFSLDSSDARIMAIGSLDLMNTQATERDTVLSGKVSKPSDVCVTYALYDAISETETKCTRTLDSGDYSIDVKRLSHENYTVIAKSKFLKITRDEKPLPWIGELQIVKLPKTMAFGTQKIPNQMTLYNREESRWEIEIFDNRFLQPKWELYASISALSPANASRPAINDSFVYVGDDNSISRLQTHVPYMIARSGLEEQESIVWASSQGILLQLDASNLYSDTQYNATIEWTLQTTP